jgi:hypothetical protein
MDEGLSLEQPETGILEEVLGLERPRRDPKRAAVLSALLVGAGQVYNRRLDRAILTWLWAVILIGVGFAMFFLGLLGHWTRGLPAPAPLGDVIAANGWAAASLWCLTWIGFWAWNIRDAADSARKITEGLIDIRHPLRWQLVHVLGSQLMGLIPIVGFLFPPGVVSEALDAAHQRRTVDHGKLLREGGQALLEWAAVRIALFSGAGLFVLWVIWWVVRAIF